jgi:threonine/homoserine efflux transporter RhtA/heme A synthase
VPGRAGRLDGRFTGRVPAPLLVLAGIVSLQVGAALAGRTFGQVTPAVLTGLRLWAAAVLMAVLAGRGLGRSIRGLARDRAWRDAAVVAAFGLTLGIMNFSIYQSFARIPLGIAVTIEFLGPLGVAVASSRRLADLAWVALAGCGVALLSNGWGSLAAHAPHPARGPGVAGGGVAGTVLVGTVLAGLVFALVSAACWAAYILLSRSTGQRFSGSSGLVIAMLIAAIVVTPPAAVQAARPGSTLSAGVIATGVAAGVLSSVIPYRLELEALRVIPTRIFGIWMSVEPAIAALAGLVLLHQALAPREWAAVGCVVIASAGAARETGRARGRSGLVATLTERDTLTMDHVSGHLTARPGAAGPPGEVPRSASPSPGRRVLAAGRRWAGAVLAPSQTAMRRIALAGVITSAGIIMTGAGVRLTESGLGCPDWPRCTATSIVAGGTTGDPLAHRWVEFGNRLVTVAIFVVAVVVCLAAWQYRPGGTGRRRKDLLWLAAAQPAGILAQALLGGVVVLTKLDPVWVSVHFLASMALVAATVALYVRCAEGTGPARLLVPRTVQRFAFGAVAVLGLMLAAGTVVTGTGPLAGAGAVKRFNLPLAGVTQFHADIGWLLGGLVIALVLALRLTGAPRRAARLSWLLLALIGLQGVIGYAQYFSGLPAGLVWFHVTGSVAIWVTALLLLFALRERSPAAAAGPPEAAPAVTGGTAPAAGSPPALAPDARTR